MTGKCNIQKSAIRPDNYSYPALRKLGLEPDDFVVLARQGSISCERRGERTLRKLRFRKNGRQLVRSIASLELALVVQEELDLLQTGVRLERWLAALVRAASEVRRRSTHELEPELRENGYHRHGGAIRKTRRKRN